MKTPCEKVLWFVLPAIRKELVRSLVQEHGYTQRETARLLGLSDAAVSQYLSKKRGRLDIKEKGFIAEVATSSERIVKGGTKVVDQEICRLCGLLRTNRSLKDMIDKAKSQTRSSKA
jgi:predicted transcriptional regulator